MWAHFRFVTLGLALGLGFVRTGHAQLTLPGFGPASSANSDDKAHARSGGAKAAASATIAPAAIPGRARQDETELDAARRALEAADVPFEENEIMPVLLESRAGELAMLSTRLASGGVGVRAIYITGTSGNILEVAVATDNIARARRALE
jgi:hypothetical protein